MAKVPEGQKDGQQQQGGRERAPRNPDVAWGLGRASRRISVRRNFPGEMSDRLGCGSRG